MKNTTKPINCSCGAVLFKISENSVDQYVESNIDGLTIKCGKCGQLQKVCVVIIPQIRVEPVKVD